MDSRRNDRPVLGTGHLLGTQLGGYIMAREVAVKRTGVAAPAHVQSNQTTSNEVITMNNATIAQVVAASSAAFVDSTVASAAA